MKLQLTQRVLGCGSLKELGVHFSKANRNTSFDVERARKWIHGIATPRDRHVYADWASVICSTRGGQWIAACSVDEFAEELAAVGQVDSDQLEALAQTLRDHLGPKDTNVDPVGGVYMTYSRAFSRYYEGYLVRGALDVQRLSADRYRLSYREKFLERGGVQVAGAARLFGDILCCQAASGTGPFPTTPFMFQLRTPGHPPHLLYGQMTTVAIFGPERRPGASPFLAIRTDSEVWAKLSEEICYLEASDAAIAADVGRLGLPASAAPAVAETLTRLFGPAGVPLIVAEFHDVAEACTALVRAGAARGDADGAPIR